MIEAYYTLQNKWAFWGLFIDIIGFSLLIYDLISLQSLINKSANTKIKNLQQIDGMESSIDHIEQFCNGIAKIIRKQAEIDLQTAQKSMIFSYIGAAMVICGFIFQILGLFFH